MSNPRTHSTVIFKWISFCACRTHLSPCSIAVPFVFGGLAFDGSKFYGNFLTEDEFFTLNGSAFRGHWIFGDQFCSKKFKIVMITKAVIIRWEWQLTGFFANALHKQSISKLGPAYIYHWALLFGFEWGSAFFPGLLISNLQTSARLLPILAFSPSFLALPCILGLGRLIHFFLFSASSPYFFYLISLHLLSFRT